MTMQLTLTTLALIVGIAGAAGCDDPATVQRESIESLRQYHEGAARRAVERHAKSCYEHATNAYAGWLNCLHESMTNWQAGFDAGMWVGKSLKTEYITETQYVDRVVTQECTRQHCTNACVNCGTWRPNQWLGDGSIVTNSVNVEAGE